MITFPFFRVPTANVSMKATGHTHRGIFHVVGTILDLKQSLTNKEPTNVWLKVNAIIVKMQGQ
jgi:hypothetical protein